VLSSETERQLILGQVDLAYQNIGALESAIEELRGKNDSLAVLSTLTERVGILKDVLGVETERLWSSLVIFSEEGDIQLTIHQKRKTPSVEIWVWWWGWLTV
jgi:GTP-sensing pleiotropic transcriptional regulator CodY